MRDACVREVILRDGVKLAVGPLLAERLSQEEASEV